METSLRCFTCCAFLGPFRDFYNHSAAAYAKKGGESILLNDVMGIRREHCIRHFVSDIDGSHNYIGVLTTAILTGLRANDSNNVKTGRMNDLKNWFPNYVPCQDSEKVAAAEESADENSNNKSNSSTTTISSDALRHQLPRTYYAI